MSDGLWTLLGVVVGGTITYWGAWRAALQAERRSALEQRRRTYLYIITMAEKFALQTDYSEAGAALAAAALLPDENIRDASIELLKSAIASKEKDAGNIGDGIGRFSMLVRVDLGLDKRKKHVRGLSSA